MSAAPPIPPVPTDIQGDPKSVRKWVVQAARVINLMLSGKLNAVTTVTLAASATSTTLIDSRIGAWSFLGLMPQTAHAAVALASGSLYVVPTVGSAAINHPSTADTDKTFTVSILG